MSKRAFTLLEIIIVVLIIGTLAAIGIPNLVKTREHAVGKEAISNLKLIAAAERIVRMESNNALFVACACNDAATCARTTETPTFGCNHILKLSLTTQNWSYQVVNDPPTTFSATATRQNTVAHPVGVPFNTCVRTLTSASTTDEPTRSSVGACP